MKKNLLGTLIGLAALIVCNNCFAQTTYTWIGNNGSWATSTNWSPTRTTPLANDILQFTNGATNSPTNVPTQTIGRLIINNNSNITLSGGGGNQTLTIGNGTGDDLLISSGSLTQNSSLETIALAASSTGNIAGTFNVNGIFNTDAANVVTTVTGTINNVSTVTCTNASRLLMQSGSIYIHAMNGGNIPTATWNVNSNCNFTSLTSTAPTNLTQAFGNVTYDCPNHGNTGVNLNSTLTTVNGDLTIKFAGNGAGASGKASRPLYLATNTDLTLTIGGNLNIDHYSNEATWVILCGGTANVTVNVGGNFNLSETGVGSTYFDFFVGTTLNTVVMNVAGNYNQTGGYFDFCFYPTTGTNNTELRLSGNFTHTASDYFITSTTDAGTPNGKIIFNKAGTQTISVTNPQYLIYTNFEIQNGSTVELLSNLYLTSEANAVWGGKFVVNSGGIFDASTFLLMSTSGAGAGANNAFNLNSGGGIITANTNGIQNTTLGSISTSIATRTYSSAANYTYDGTAVQNSGTFTTTPTANQVNNLTINNTAGANTTGVTLQQEFKVASVCTFYSGVFTTTSTNILTINDNATMVGTDLDAGSTKYVNGPLKKIGNDPFAFAVGKISHGCRPIYISAPANTTDQFRAELIRGDASLLGSITASGLARVSGCEYWYLDRLVGSSSVDVSLSWSGESPCNSQSYVTDLPNLVVAHNNGTNWDTYGNDGGTTGNAVKGTVTWNNVSTFSPFSLGSLVWYSNPLTIKFVNLQATEKDGNVKLEWANVAEKGVDKYYIEHSTDGLNFSLVNNTLATKNNSERADYSWWHMTAANGMNYYRVKAVEYNGAVTYSAVVRINIGKNLSDIVVYPNPVKDKQLNIAAPVLVAGKYDISVINMSGQKVMQQVLNHTGGSISMLISLPESTKAGLYSIKITGTEKSFVKTFIVQ